MDLTQPVRSRFGPPPADPARPCPSCGRKPGEVAFRLDTNGRRRGKCVDCWNAYRRRENDPVGNIRRSKARRLLRYGMTIPEWDAEVAKRDGRCDVCGRKRRLVQDHSHRTGERRGLLCGPCNLALGHLSENEAFAAKLILYMRRWGGG